MTIGIERKGNNTIGLLPRSKSVSPFTTKSGSQRFSAGEVREALELRESSKLYEKPSGYLDSRCIHRARASQEQVVRRKYLKVKGPPR